MLVGVVASLCIAAAQEPPPVSFKTEVNYVEVGAIVTDEQGRFVRTLTKDDFQILEDGRPQKVAGLSLVDLPVQRPPCPRPICSRLSPMCRPMQAACKAGCT
jgi:hypothetical protein